MRKVLWILVLVPLSFSLFMFACAAKPSKGFSLNATPTVVASGIRVITRWGNTTGLADSVILTHYVGSYPGSPDSIRKAYPVGVGRSDTVVYLPPQGYSITGIVYARLKTRGGAQGPRDSVTWASSLPLTNRVTGFAVQADTLP